MNTINVMHAMPVWRLNSMGHVWATVYAGRPMTATTAPYPVTHWNTARRISLKMRINRWRCMALYAQTRTQAQAQAQARRPLMMTEPR